MTMEHFPGEHPLMTCEEAATYLRLHRRTVGRLLKVGKLPGVKVGQQWRLRRVDLDAYLVGREAGPVETEREGGHEDAPPTPAGKRQPAFRSATAPNDSAATGDGLSGPETITAA